MRDKINKYIIVSSRTVHILLYPEPDAFGTSAYIPADVFYNGINVKAKDPIQRKLLKGTKS